MNLLEQSAEGSRSGAVGGSADKHVNVTLLAQLLQTVWLGDMKPEDEATDDDPRTSAVTILDNLKPRDEAEGMLISLLIATHNGAMECFRRAMLQDARPHERQANLCEANKLVRSFAALLAALQEQRKREGRTDG